MSNVLSDLLFWNCDTIICKSDSLHPTGLKIEKQCPYSAHGAVKSILPAALLLFGVHLYAAQEVHGCCLQLAVLFQTDGQPSSHLEMSLSAGLFELLAIRIEGSLRDGARLKMHHCTTGKVFHVHRQCVNHFTFNTTLQQSPVDSNGSHQWFCWGWTDSAALRWAWWRERTYLKVNFSALPPSGCCLSCSSLREAKHRTVDCRNVNKCDIIQFTFMNKKKMWLYVRVYACFCVMKEKHRFDHEYKIPVHCSIFVLKRYDILLLLRNNEWQI